MTLYDFRWGAHHERQVQPRNYASGGSLERTAAVRNSCLHRTDRRERCRQAIFQHEAGIRNRASQEFPNMCGIAGVVNMNGRPVDRTHLEDMADLLSHRGPDGIGIFAEDNAGLAHARLSIIDLACGQQPMTNDDRSIWISFNGEIFNYLELREELQQKGHRFTTRSDTEVLLRLYEEEGPACVERLNGQWAFAIWDRRSRRLFLSRDRMGIRPL